jgi:hypothetical protein
MVRILAEQPVGLARPDNLIAADIPFKAAEMGDLL